MGSMAVSISEANEDSQEHSLPYGWKKLARRRQQTGQGNKTWDVYIIAPCGKKLRSNPEIEKYLSENPDVQIDRDVTNTSKPRTLESTVAPKVQDPSPPANKQTLEKSAKISSPQRSDKSPPPTVGKRKTSDKPKRSLQIQLEKLPEPFQEKASESLSKPTPKSSSSLDADQKSNESKDKEPTNVPDPVVLDKPRRGRKPKNPLPKADDSSAVPEVKDKEPRVTSPPPVLSDKKDKAPTPKAIIKPAVFVPKIEIIEKVAAFETKKGQEAAVKSLADGPSAPPTPKSVKKVPRAATPPPVKKATPTPPSLPVKKVVQLPTPPSPPVKKVSQESAPTPSKKTAPAASAKVSEEPKEPAPTSSKKTVPAASPKSSSPEKNSSSTATTLAPVAPSSGAKGIMPREETTPTPPSKK